VDGGEGDVEGLVIELFEGTATDVFSIAVLIIT
jgi:hypothetical protein